jgi:predicted TIM-barrel fold metal-dependent hydrolase
MTANDTGSAHLRLEDFAPQSMLVVPENVVVRSRFPAIDAHNHLGRWLSQDHSWMVRDVPDLLGVLDDCNIAGIVNLDGMWGDELEANLDRYDHAFPGRFYTFAQVDWDLLQHSDFGASMARQLEDSVRRGARGLKVWKTLGLHYRDASGALLAIDDQRLFDLWECAGELQVPVLIHIADPVAFFRPLDRFNERWEELHRHPDWHFYGPQFPPFEALIEQFERLIARHPRTQFIGAHVGCYPENLGWVSRIMDRYANFHADIAARVAELGRQPYSARRLFECHADRILFGLDGFPPTAEMYRPYFRFLETDDGYFPYSARGIGGTGRWNIYGINLPDEILRKVYHDNAYRLLHLREADRGRS